jgi:hypothetical protein
VHVVPSPQVPQLTMPPQPFEAVPQANPWQGLAFGVQQLLPSQVWPEVQVLLQAMVPPQPLETFPQASP